MSGSDNCGQVRDRGGSFLGMDRRPEEGDVVARSCWRRGSEPFGYQGEEQRQSRQREEQRGQRP